MFFGQSHESVQAWDLGLSPVCLPGSAVWGDADGTLSRPAANLPLMHLLDQRRACTRPHSPSPSIQPSLPLHHPLFPHPSISHPPTLTFTYPLFLLPPPPKIPHSPSTLSNAVITSSASSEYCCTFLRLLCWGIYLFHNI